MWTRQLALASSSLTSFWFWGCQWWLQLSTDLPWFLSVEIWFNASCTWSVITMILLYIPCTSKPPTAIHSHSWSTGNTGGTSKQYFYTQNSYFLWWNNNIACAYWGEISKYSLVSVSFLKSLKYLVNNIFPQLQNYDSEATLYSSYPAGFAEQKANGNQKLHEKHIFKNGVLTSLSLNHHFCHQKYSVRHRTQTKIFWSVKWWFVGWASQSQLKHYRQYGNKTSDYKHG